MFLIAQLEIFEVKGRDIPLNENDSVLIIEVVVVLILLLESLTILKLIINDITCKGL